jgi:hypothetical protein
VILIRAAAGRKGKRVDINNLSPIDVMQFCYKLTGRVLYRHEAELILEPYWNGTQADLE